VSQRMPAAVRPSFRKRILFRGRASPAAVHALGADLVPLVVPHADGSDSAIGGYCPYGRGGKGFIWSLSQVTLRELLVSITSRSGCAGRARAQAVDEPM
jgi:hypothetical protein